ncbi:hypothetical protein F4859DRAFT_467950 [Xylaria cf. heliscus]|nr:hypothetical protein F4859DRAFT_467950 [Xylaria cf. heliscus]
MAAANKVKFSTVLAWAASFRLSMSNCFCVILPDRTAASPYLARSSLGDALWSMPYHCFRVRDDKRPYAKMNCQPKNPGAQFATDSPVAALRRPSAVARDAMADCRISGSKANGRESIM